MMVPAIDELAGEHDGDGLADTGPQSAKAPGVGELDRERAGGGHLGRLRRDQAQSERGGLDASNPMALLGMRYTNRAAEGWDGDRYTMLEKDGALLFYFASVWDSEQDQEQFVANLGDQARFLSTSRQALASHLAGEDEGSLQQWSAALGTWSHTALLFNGGDLGLADLVADVDVLAPIAR